MSPTIAVKRYNLGLPRAIYEEVQSIASAESSTVLNILITFIKLGIHLYKAMRDGDKVLVQKNSGSAQEILIII